MRLAYDYLSQARELTQRGNGTGTADDVTNLGLICWKLGRLDEAAEHFSQVAQLFRDLDSADGTRSRTPTWESPPPRAGTYPERGPGARRVPADPPASSRCQPPRMRHRPRPAAGPVWPPALSCRSAPYGHRPCPAVPAPYGHRPSPAAGPVRP